MLTSLSRPQMVMPRATLPARIFSNELNETIEPYILEQTPSVISVGDRTMNRGYSYVWKAGQNPYSITPHGKIITLEVMGDIPYLRRNSELCRPRDAVPNDYRIMAMPSIAGSSYDGNVTECIATELAIPDAP